MYSQGSYFHHNDTDPYFLLVPCGKCINCLKLRRLQWTFRLKYEFMNSFTGFFLTLSEDSEHLHPLDKRDVQLFIKCARKAGYVFTYYSIGEYGSKHGRPHYHIMFFFKTPVDPYKFFDFCKSHWTQGNIELSECNARRINYICHYHIRPKHPKNAQFSVPCFQLMSKGLGLQFMTPRMLQYLQKSEDNLIHDMEGMTIPLPRYYRKKFDIPQKDFNSASEDFLFVRDAARARGYDEFEYLRDIKCLDEFYLHKYSNQEHF